MPNARHRRFFPGPPDGLSGPAIPRRDVDEQQVIPRRVRIRHIRGLEELPIVLVRMDVHGPKTRGRLPGGHIDVGHLALALVRPDVDLRLDRLAEELYRETEGRLDIRHDARDPAPRDIELVRAPCVDVEDGLDHVRGIRSGRGVP